MKENSIDVKKTILYFKDQFKILRQHEADNQHFIAIASEIHQKKLTVLKTIDAILQIKKQNAFSKICKEWNIDMRYIHHLLSLCTPSASQNTKSHFNYIIHGPPHLKEKVESQFFKNLLYQYIAKGTSNCTIIFDNTNNGICIDLEKNSFFFDPASIKTELFLSDTFFDQPKDEQECIIYHEATHAIMYHLDLEIFLIFYYINHSYNKNHDLNDWLNIKKDDTSHKKINDIIQHIVKNNFFNSSHEFLQGSSSFLTLSHAMEYEADSFFPLRNLELAKKFEDILVQKSQEKNNILHPSFENRARWMKCIRKLLEAEKSLQKSCMFF